MKIGDKVKIIANYEELRKIYVYERWVVGKTGKIVNRYGHGKWNVQILGPRGETTYYYLEDMLELIPPPPGEEGEI